MPCPLVAGKHGSWVCYHPEGIRTGQSVEQVCRESWFIKKEKGKERLKRVGCSGRFSCKDGASGHAVLGW